jgi:hypothetical protein
VRVRVIHYVRGGSGMVARCGTAARTFSWNLHATEHPDRVTCRVCLYHLGLYMPLVKLKEHQDAESAGRAKYGKRDPYYAVTNL